MPRSYYTAGEAARALGISVDTLRRWDRQGRIRTERDAANRRIVPAEEIERLAGAPPSRGLSAQSDRRRFPRRLSLAKIGRASCRERVSRSV
jgi:excisionase family DNA binding protein